MDLLLADPSFNDAYKVRKILESLLSPAVDVVKPLGISSPPDAYVTQLDSAFGVLDDGEDFFGSISELQPKQWRETICILEQASQSPYKGNF